MFNKKLKAMTMGLAFAMCITGMPSSSLMVGETVYAAESSVESASISEILANQLSDGGWRKNYKTTSGDWAKSTIDNGATYTEIRKLAAEYSKTKNSAYSKAVIKGINFLITMQYSNGGWPQVYKGSGYHAAITFNDNAMISVMRLLDDVANRKGDFSFVDSSLANKCKASVDKGINCILKCQVTANGTLTVWGQQHDKDTLKPTSARAYEVASLCSAESANIISFLNSRTKTTAINKSIQAGVQWFKNTAITGIKVVKANNDTVVQADPSSTKQYWGRFYEIGSNKPIFVGRDGVVKYQLSQIEQERRTGYAWYGNWGSSVVKINVGNIPVVSPTPSATVKPSVTPTPTATVKPSVTPTPSTTPSSSVAPSAKGLKVDYTINNWGSSYQVNFKISNPTSNTINGWNLKVKKSDITIGSSWCVDIKESGSYYVITPQSWNSSIGKGGSVEFGVQGSEHINSKINYVIE